MIFADCGNTAVKLAQGAERVRLAPGLVASWLKTHPDDELMLLPGAAATALIVHQAWTGRLIEVGRDLGLPDVGQYPGMGMDRIVAGLAAGRSTIVIDAGTATTLTAWGSDGRFAGGLILPGPHAMIAGLCALAPALPSVEPMGTQASAAQRDTHGAIAAGVGIGHVAMITGCLERLISETGIHQVLITGGGAASIPGGEQRPWLVLEGLARLG